jgi:hypothetical protein
MSAMESKQRAAQVKNFKKRRGCQCYFEFASREQLRLKISKKRRG